MTFSSQVFAGGAFALGTDPAAIDIVDPPAPSSGNWYDDERWLRAERRVNRLASSAYTYSPAKGEERSATIYVKYETNENALIRLRQGIIIARGHIAVRTWINEGYTISPIRGAYIVSDFDEFEVKAVETKMIRGYPLRYILHLEGRTRQHIPIPV